MGTISVEFQQIKSGESIWTTSLTLKAFVMRPDNKGARKAINEGPDYKFQELLGFELRRPFSV